MRRSLAMLLTLSLGIALVPLRAEGRDDYVPPEPECTCFHIRCCSWHACGKEGCHELATDIAGESECRRAARARNVLAKECGCSVNYRYACK